MIRKDLKCRKHRYIGKEIENIPYRSSLPLECSICGKMYFPKDPLCTRTVSNKTINMCFKCNTKVKCALCKTKFDIHKFFIAECIECRNIDFFCRRCARKIITLPSKRTSKREASRKLKRILKEFYPELSDDFLDNLKKEQRSKDFKTTLGYLFIHFNVIFPEIFDVFKEDDGADWWKNKS
ncbi:MAG: hypothetical protein DRP74_06960 [Candidatus Omnitrophota bacterium]|nr:MAG: hypothetical protein DRP74_06960 [Candidatus Omnitrophota bacterium]